MSVYEGVYKSLLQGVSQQTPQEREDGQLGAQVNMLSDPVTGLRRRGGVKFKRHLVGDNPNGFLDIVEFSGSQRVLSIDTFTGTLRVYSDFAEGMNNVSTFQNDYFRASKGKLAIRTTSARENYFIVNTEKVPTKELIANSTRDPSKLGYFSIRSSEFGKKFSVRISYGSVNAYIEHTASLDTAATASPEYIANKFYTGMLATPNIADNFIVTLSGTTIALEVRGGGASYANLNIETPTTGGYMVVSGTSRVSSKSELLGNLPSSLNGYIMAVGNTANSAYYKYVHDTRVWVEVGAYEPTYRIINEPMFVYLNAAGNPVLKTLGIKTRGAGNEDNNPLPKFIGYGITGISSYQSRLVILNGSYVNLSKTTDYSQFMRTTVTELLDDDAIEISSAAASSAQYEYAVQYNKDLVLIAQGQQAVIPANATVLTPKTAVIYPSTKLDLSLAVQPTIVGRTMYYTYQRGTDYYQVGEFIPNTYTEAQYYSQNITDHIPLYAKGLCTTMAASSTNNMVVLCSDSTEVLVNQYMWQGDDRPLMSFHKWVFPRRVMFAKFLEDILVLFMHDGFGGITVGTLNVQLNQLDDKPVPYLDIYHYLDVYNEVAEVPNNVVYAVPNKTLLATSIYDSRNMRHKLVQHNFISNTQIACPYNGRIAIGHPYTSSFTLTPPFIKDDAGKVIAGTRSTIQQLRMTFKDTGSFGVSVKDTMGSAYIGEGNTALTWSETDLGYSWVNSIGSVTIPCRTRLASTECTVQTQGTTDMNLVSTEYVLRIAQKRRRL